MALSHVERKALDEVTHSLNSLNNKERITLEGLFFIGMAEDVTFNAEQIKEATKTIRSIELKIKDAISWLNAIMEDQ